MIFEFTDPHKNKYVFKFQQDYYSSKATNSWYLLAEGTTEHGKFFYDSNVPISLEGKILWGEYRKFDAAYIPETIRKKCQEKVDILFENKMFW